MLYDIGLGILSVGCTPLRGYTSFSRWSISAVGNQPVHPQEQVIREILPISLSQSHSSWPNPECSLIRFLVRCFPSRTSLSIRRIRGGIFSSFLYFDVGVTPPAQSLLESSSEHNQFHYSSFFEIVREKVNLPVCYLHESHSLGLRPLTAARFHTIPHLMQVSVCGPAGSALVVLLHHLLPSGTGTTHPLSLRIMPM